MAITATDSEPMRRALDLAKQGIGWVEPNPAVGAVIVDDCGRIVGEGWHQRFGGPHAEVHALRSAGEAARGATLYVTLEPCCHFGKTPPCSKAVIAAGIRRVVVATIDPAAHVSGGGIQELKAAGVEVEIGLLGDETRELIAPFSRLMTQGLPWFHAKWAMTLDGKTATRNGSSKWISNEQSRAVVHQLRGRMDGIIAGIGTVLADDPLLTARPTGPRTAIRIVLDSNCRIPLDSQLISTVADAPVLIVTSESSSTERCDLLRSKGAEVLQLKSDENRKPDLMELALELGRRRLTNVLIEGGSQVLGSFFDCQLVDEVHAFIAPKMVGGQRAQTPIAGIGLESMSNAAGLDVLQIQQCLNDIYIRGRTARPAINADA